MTGPAPRGISVTGRGVVAAVPDVMHLVLGVSVQRDSVKAARSDAATLGAAVVDAVRSTGVAAADMHTARFAVHPEYRHTERRRLLDGYRVVSTLTVTVRDLDRAGDAIDAAVAAGGNDLIVEQVQFAVDDDRAVLQAARDAAWRDAREKAVHLAALAGVTLGQPESVAEANEAGTGPWRVSALAAESATPIERGTTDVVVLLDVRFAVAST